MILTFKMVKQTHILYIVFFCFVFLFNSACVVYFCIAAFNKPQLSVQILKIVGECKYGSV